MLDCSYRHIVSLAISPFLIRRLKSGGLLRFGLIIQIIGFGLVFFLPTKVAALAAFIALGLGGFYIDSGSNSYIADNFPEKKKG
jgi:hypothetical protein